MSLLRRGIANLMRLAFEALYYPLAPLYDKISYYAFLGQWQKWQLATLPRLQGKRVLEVGCGTGTLLTELLGRGYKAYGLDYSGPMLKQARKKLAAKGYGSRLVRGRVQQLPFPDESFETVVATFPTQWIFDVNALSEITRVLYPGGRLVMVDTAQIRAHDRKSAALLWFYQKVLGYGVRPKSSSRMEKFVQKYRLPFSEAGLVRRDETFEDEFGEAHIIIALKVW